jgi:hypothetical protein
MKRFPLILGVFALLAGAPAAHAARAIELHAKTAGELARMCAANSSNERGDAEINFCHGFAQGVADTVLHFRPKALCFPHPVPTRTETLGAFVRWVHADPKREQLPAAAGLFNFLHAEYPCS